MFNQEFHYRWEWEFKAPPAALWVWVADTNRFNYDVGLPTLKRIEKAETHTLNAKQVLRAKIYGQNLDYEEQPFEWLRPHRFGVNRKYRTGPIDTFRQLAKFVPHNNGTKLIYEVWVKPRNLLGFIAIPIQIGLLSRAQFEKIFRRYDALASTQKLPLAAVQPPQFASGGRERLAKTKELLLAKRFSAALVNRLVETVENGDKLALARLRPYALADYWGEERRVVLELCLHATRVGLLNLQWEVLCPLCRGAKQTTTALSDLKTEVHCATCNVSFTTNFQQSVELTFHPNPAIRPIEVNDFCVAGPQTTPHIIAQQLMPPHTQRPLQIPLEAGRYRLRALELNGGQLLTATPNGDTVVTAQAAVNGWAEKELRPSLEATINLENATPQEQLLILERLAWNDQATTAAEVIALQAFRDLFANEALRPGDQISVGSLTILFTDLKASTQLYRQIGDAPAFGIVMNHFDVLKQAVTQEGGAIVKTIGDAVMAVFQRPAAALQAVLQAQQQLAHSHPPLKLKAGLHYGPCIAVNLNDRLDYFGTVVNAASRIVELSSGEDVILSATIQADPEVQALLKNLRSEKVQTTLKGFDAEQFELWQVS